MMNWEYEENSEELMEVYHEWLESQAEQPLDFFYNFFKKVMKNT